MDIERIPLRTLKASGQPRPLITEAVDKLAASIREVASSRFPPRCAFPLWMAASRLMATRSLPVITSGRRARAGWAEIDAIIVDAGEHLQTELIEIDENLCRAELAASQRAQAIRRRKQIWGVASGIPPKNFGRKEGSRAPDRICYRDGESSGQPGQASISTGTRDAIGDDLER